MATPKGTGTPAPPPASSSDTARSRAAWLLHAAAGAVVVLGIAAQVVRPLAPDLGAPPAPATAFDAAFLARAAAYRSPLYVAALAALLLRIAVTAAIALSPPGRRLVARITSAVGHQRPARAAAAVIVVAVVAADLLIAPLAFWAGYVHDGRFGLRTQGAGGWLYEWAVLHAPVWLGVGLLAVVGYWVARRWPRTWPPLAGLAAGLAAAVMTFASPLVLEPLLHDFRPLPDGDVRDEVVAVLEAAGEDVSGMLVADASRRSNRQNAYISGFGASERVVLYDTLVEQRPPAEVGVVLAHELAHKRNADIVRFVLLAAAGTLIAAYSLDWVARRRLRKGRQATAADPSAAAVMLLVLVALNILSMPVQSLVSRRAEAAADLGSLDFTGEPEVFSAMQTGLTEANLSEPLPPALVTLWWGSHPPTMARLNMARWWQQR